MESIDPVERWVAAGLAPELPPWELDMCKVIDACGTLAAVKRAALAIVVAATACRQPEAARQPPASPPGATPGGAPDGASGARATPAAPADRPIDDAQLVALLGAADARGAVLVTDVAAGAVIASAGIGRDVAAPVMSLSVIKLYLAAEWWEHELGDGDFMVRGRRVTVHDVLVDGWDHPGEEMAVELRRRLGAAAVLAELRGDGLDGLTLPADADDARWGSALSIGEHDVQVTLAQVTSFLGAIGGGSRLLRPRTQQRMQAAMRDTVERGTAKSAGARLGASAWRLGGKTGTGPAGASPYDGWFAGLIFDAAEPRYAIAVYIDRGGPGGGVAAGIAADVTLRIAASRDRP